MRTIKMLLLALTASFLFAGCDTDGPAEDAGEAFDDAAEEIGEDTEDAIEN